MFDSLVDRLIRRFGQHYRTIWNIILKLGNIYIYIYVCEEVWNPPGVAMN